MSSFVLRNARIAGAAAPVDIEITDGRIAAIVPDPGTPGPDDIDCDGRVVIPGLIESHLHLDKALLDGERPNPEGTLAAAIEITADLKRSFTPEAVRARARRVLDQAILNGTTHVRAHPDVDPIVGLTCLDAMLDLREEYRDRIDLQVVAFPQEGIVQAPGTLDLLREALGRGADVVGGCTYNEPDLATCHRHIDLVFDLAEEFGVPVDMHADLADDASDPRFALAEHIAGVTEERGMSGRVALGHMNSLAGRSPEERKDALARLAAAGVAVVPLPATDMHLSGRADTVNTRRGIAPVRELWDAGVVTAYSSNNVRNAFTPYGNADLLDIGLLLAQTSHLSGPADLARVLAMATTEAARVLGLTSYGLRPGADADLVVLSSTDLAGALLDRPDRCFVIKRGRVVARTTRTTFLEGAPA